MEVLTMSDQTSEMEVTDASEQNTSQEQERVYSQDEFDKHMAGLKSSLTRKYEKQYAQYAELGDLEELRELKARAESKRVEDAKKRGEFDKLMSELAEKKDAEIRRRDDMIREFKIDVPLVNAAAKFKSVNPEQVSKLLRNNIRLNDESQVEVVDDKGEVRYGDDGKALSVDSFVQEFLQTNPHFVGASAATTNTNSSNPRNGGASKLDLSKLDLTRPEHRKLYAEARRAGQI
jgi:hypothetical protein